MLSRLPQASSPHLACTFFQKNPLQCDEVASEECFGTTRSTGRISLPSASWKKTPRTAMLMPGFCFQLVLGAWKLQRLGLSESYQEFRESLLAVNPDGPLADQHRSCKYEDMFSGKSIDISGKAGESCCSTGGLQQREKVCCLGVPQRYVSYGAAREHLCQHGRMPQETVSCQ